MIKPKFTANYKNLVYGLIYEMNEIGQDNLTRKQLKLLDELELCKEEFEEFEQD